MKVHSLNIFQILFTVFVASIAFYSIPGIKAEYITWDFYGDLTKEDGQQVSEDLLKQNKAKYQNWCDKFSQKSKPDKADGLHDILREEGMPDGELLKLKAIRCLPTEFGNQTNSKRFYLIPYHQTLYVLLPTDVTNSDWSTETLKVTNRIVQKNLKVEKCCGLRCLINK